jgi:ABC-2 type transport system ATP-binding protein
LREPVVPRYLPERFGGGLVRGDVTEGGVTLSDNTAQVLLRQRLSLAMALAARPDVAFLDEPTSGVDVNGRTEIRVILRELAERGCCVVVATHELDEAERVADRAVVFDHGRILASGTLDELRSGQRQIRFRLPESTPTPDFSPLGQPVKREGDQYVIEGSTAGSMAALTAFLAERHLEPIDLRAGQSSLEDVFRRLTNGESA